MFRIITVFNAFRLVVRWGLSAPKAEKVNVLVVFNAFRLVVRWGRTTTSTSSRVRKSVFNAFRLVVRWGRIDNIVALEAAILLSSMPFGWLSAGDYP